MRKTMHFISRIAAILLIALIAFPAWAQGPGNVTLQVKNAPLQQVLQLIRQQANVKFVYNDEELRKAEPVTVNLDDTSILQALNQVFINQPYTLENNGGGVYIIKPLGTTSKPGISGKQVVKGKIVDAQSGEPLIGATIQDAQSREGTISGADGTFTLEVPDKVQRITASYIGYASKTMKLTGNVLIVLLEESRRLLDEVVVIGYGSAQRKDLTGSVASIKTDEILQLPALTVDDALQGKAAGVQVAKADGSPGGAVRIRVRGGSSLKGNVDPLYIIDGIPFEIQNNYISSTEIVNPLEAANYGNDMNSSVSGSFMRGLNSLGGLNLNDVESISILKDASATAIYGSKAANGVVIITTKKGRRDTKPVFNFNYYLSYSDPLKEKVLDGEQYLNAMRGALEQSNANMELNKNGAIPAQIRILDRNINTNKDKIAFLNGLSNANTDWIDLVTRTGMAQNVDFSVSGGGRNSRYYTSFSYTDQEGTLIATDFERYTVKSSIDNDITKNFRMGTNITFGYNKNNITNGIYAQAMSAPPILSPYNEDGTYANYNLLPDLQGSYMGFQNPLAVASGKNLAKTYDFKGSIYGEVDILKGLKFKSVMSVNYINYNQSNYIPSYVKVGGFYGAETSGGGQGTESQSVSTRMFFENTLSYNKTFNEDHRIDALLGTSWEEQKSSFSSVTAKGYPDDHHLNNLGSAQMPTTVSGANPSSQNSLLSFYLRANYVWKERYLFTFTGRSDNSSKFAKGNRVGYFPSGAIAWRISEEAFLQDATWIDEIKLRASMGKTGTQSISDHMFRTLYSPASYAGSSVLYPSQLGNDALKWESTLQKDLGVDFSFFGNRLSGSLAYYYKKTDGALLSITPAPSSGYTTMVANIAEIKNTGWEIELNGDFIRTRNFKWSGSLNISNNESKVLKLQGDNFSSDTGRNELNLGTTVYREGESLGLLCGYKALGIIRTQEQLEDYRGRFNRWAMIIPDVGIGSVELALDENGMYYQDVIGNCTPDFYGGYTNTFQYKNWALMATFTFSYGNDLIYQKDVTDMNFDSYANRGSNVLNGSTPNRPTDRPAVLTNSANFLTDLNVYDASYLKLQSLSLNYSLPAKYCKKLRLNNLSIYGTATNLFTLTDYPGPDPAVSDDPYSVAGGGRDVTSYPTVRSYTLGIRLGF